MQFSPFYRIVPGSDTAVLFVHGIVGTPAHFRDLIPLVPESWSVYNILLDGHGGSVEDFARTSMKKWKSQVHSVLKQILAVHDRVLLVGHSMGTLFCIQESFVFADRVLGLFLLNVPLHPRVRLSSVLHTLAATQGRAKPGSPAALLLSDCGVHLDPRLHTYLRWIPRYWELILECCRVRPLVEEIAHPCFCIQSERDELVSGRTYHYLCRFSNVSVTRLRGSGHFGYVEEDLEAVKARFLEMLGKF